MSAVNVGHVSAPLTDGPTLSADIDNVLRQCRVDNVGPYGCYRVTLYLCICTRVAADE